MNAPPYTPARGSDRCDRCIERLRSALLTDVSHELRTPLTLILGPLHDLEDGYFGALQPAVLHQITLAERNADRMLGLVNQLLDAARLDSGSMTLQTERRDLIPFLGDLVERFGPLAERQGIALTLAVPKRSIVLWFDPGQLDKVFANLISNALKFTPKGGGVGVRVRRCSSRTASSVAVTVTDTGPGLAGVDLARIFDRFYSAARPRISSTPGSGLGLSIAHDIAQLHGGSLEAESETGKGSTFRLTLPIVRGCPKSSARRARAAQSPAPAPAPLLVLPQRVAAPRFPRSSASAHDEPAAREERPLVLIVDDHRDARTYLHTHLQSRYRVAEATDGVEALGLARELLPDLVVSDVTMPGLDGYALCREIKNDPELDFVPVLLLTARAAPADKVAGFEDGADHYLTKPFEISELVARIASLIASRRRLLTRLGTAATSQPSRGLPLAPGVRATVADLEFLSRVRRVIENRLEEEEFNVSVLAAALAMDRSHLFRRLRHLAGLTPSALIRELRLERSARLLIESAATVGEIGWSVGFKDVSHFTKRFRARYGTTPSRFRAQRGITARRRGEDYASPLRSNYPPL